MLFRLSKARFLLQQIVAETTFICDFRLLQNETLYFEIKTIKRIPPKNPIAIEEKKSFDFFFFFNRRIVSYIVIEIRSHKTHRCAGNMLLSSDADFVNNERAIKKYETKSKRIRRKKRWNKNNNTNLIFS